MGLYACGADDTTLLGRKVPVGWRPRAAEKLGARTCDCKLTCDREDCRLGQTCVAKSKEACLSKYSILLFVIVLETRFSSDVIPCCDPAM